MSILDDINISLDKGSIEVIKYDIFNKLLKMTCEQKFYMSSVNLLRHQGLGISDAFNNVKVKTFALNLFDTLTLGDILNVCELSCENVRVLLNNGIIDKMDGAFEVLYYHFRIPQDVKTAIDIIQENKPIDISDYYTYNNKLVIVHNKPMYECECFYNPSTCRGKDIVEVHPDVASKIAYTISNSLRKTKIVFNTTIRDEFESFLTAEKIEECFKEIVENHMNMNVITEDNIDNWIV